LEICSRSICANKINKQKSVHIKIFKRDQTHLQRQTSPKELQNDEADGIVAVHYTFTTLDIFWTLDEMHNTTLVYLINTSLHNVW
jgi:hypothetical protein